VWQARARKNEWGAGHLPANAISGRIALGNGLGQKLPVESVIGMWQMGGKGNLKRWEAGTLGSCGGEGPPTANTERMRWY
jgi:hypothetical protein